MPRVLRRGNLRRESLTDEQEIDLLVGRRGAFSTENERRQAWSRHGASFATNPLARAAGWWNYDSPEPRNSKEKEWRQLERLGVLTIVEQTELARMRKLGQCLA